MSLSSDKPEEATLQTWYQTVRQQSLKLCSPLEVEDYQVQPMDDASPPKWHLAHVTWFFETFLLKTQRAGYQPFHPQYEVLFNSYYNGIGKAHPRAKRGFLSRPLLEEVLAYREYVDEAMLSLLSGVLADDVLFAVALGLHHEQQHQELILTDLKYNLGNNPLKPVYLPAQPKQVKSAMPLTWHDYAGGLVEIGAEEHGGFVYDNEKPRHKVYLDPFQLASRTVTNGEFLAFIRDGGYDRPELWLSDGWAHLAALGPERWRGPLYWRDDGDAVLEYTLAGEAPLDLQAPVCHVSGFEADAYARWCNARLPTEAEWETAAACAPMTGNFVDAGVFHPTVSAADSFYGNVWEWTASSYGPYPGFKPFAGQLGEYNGKFMANQLVLRGGSCATPQSHIRPTYRNFFYPPDRWQFSGIRLARDVG